MAAAGSTAIADPDAPCPQLYGLPLAFALRFLHWSLFGEPLAAPVAAVIAYAWTLCAQGMAWRVAHGALVRRQYPWLAEPRQ